MEKDRSSILLFIKSQYTVFCTFYSIAHFTLISLFFYHIYALVLCYFYIIIIFILLHCPLSGPDLIYISLLIIPCIIYYVTNKETLNLELAKCRQLVHSMPRRLGAVIKNHVQSTRFSSFCCGVYSFLHFQ